MDDHRNAGGSAATAALERPGAPAERAGARDPVSHRLRREVGVFAATMMGLGSIIGTGVFVSIGIAVDVAGAGVLLAILLSVVVATCNDFPGRIVNRLVRPYYNAVLRRYDEKLATAGDLDTTLKLGLGYPEGPLALLNRTGLAEHAETSQALYEALGDPAYKPARLALNAYLARKLHD